MSLEKEELDLDVLLSLLEENDPESNNGPPSNLSTTNSTDEKMENMDNTVDEKNLVNADKSYHKDRLVNSTHSSEVTNNESPSLVDPLERELLLMEEKMKRLREEILKKKNVRSSDDKPFGFTKLLAVISPGCSKSESNVRYLTGNEKEKLLSDLHNKKSEIHSGDTDSEDDEDNRTPLEAQLSSYGREMKKRIAHSKEDFSRNLSPGASNSQNKKGWKEARGGSLLPMGRKDLSLNAENKANTSVDQFSGIRIINPLISADTMKDLMAERRMIQMSAITSHFRGGEIDGDWVTIGVIVSKSETKTSQKGNQYSIWQMSDLKDCTKVVSLFLFAGAYKGLWKTTVGSVVGILNPQIMKESDKRNDGRNCLTLSVNTQEKILMMGVSKDLGWCKGRTKQGSSCRQFVSKNVCEFCVFHIQKEYQKMSSKRAEIQSSFTRIDPRKSFQKRVLGKNQVFYGGQLFSSSNNEKRTPKLNPASKAKDLATLSSLTTKLKAENLKEKDKKDSFILKRLTDEQLDTVKSVTKDNEELGQMLLAPTPGARNLLLHKSKGGPSERTPTSSVALSSHTQNLSAKEFLASTKSLPNCNTSADTPNKTPLLGRGLHPGKDLEIDLPSRLDPLKAKATSIIKKKGGILPSEKNMKRNKERAASSDFQAKVRKRILELSEEEDQEGSSNLIKKPKDENYSSTAIAVAPQKSLLGSVDINSEKFVSLMKAKSSHTSLLQIAEDEEVEKYYNSLEKKEMLENKMASTMELSCKAVVCLQCKYKAMSAADHCREERHSLKIIQATKRFFECRNCKQRVISLEKLPGRPCSHCSQSSWRRVAMAKDKKGPILESEMLSLRGDELSHISSSSSKIYINL